MEKNVLVKLVAATIFTFMIFTSASQGFANQNITIDKTNVKGLLVGTLGDDPFLHGKMILILHNG